MNKRLAAYANFAFSLAGLGVNIVSGLVFVPLYLHYIDDATYGAWFASGAVISVVGLIESGLSTVVTQKLVAAYAVESKDRFGRVAGTGVAAAAVLGAAVFLLGAIAAVVSPRLFGCPEAQLHRLQLAVLLSALGAGEMIVGYTLGAIPQALQTTFRSGLYFIGSMICGLVGTLIGLKCGWGVVALGFGPVCTGTVMLAGHLINIRLLWRQFNLPRFRLEWNLMSELWRDARALLFGRVSNVISANLQAPAAAIAISAEASTMISLTGRILSLVPMVIERIGSATFAGAAHVYQSGREQSERFVGEIMTVSVVLSGMGAGLAICFTAPLMRLWVGEARYAGDIVLWLLVANTCLTMRQGAYANLLTAFGLARFAGRYLGIDAVVRLALVVGLTPLLRLPGIPVAHLLATAFSALVLGQLVRSKAAISGKVLWLSGGVGFLLGLGSAVVWRVVVPAPSSWAKLVTQTIAYAGAVILLTVGFDRAWRQILMKNMSWGMGILKRAACFGTGNTAA